MRACMFGIYGFGFNHRAGGGEQRVACASRAGLSTPAPASSTLQPRRLRCCEGGRGWGPRGAASPPYLHQALTFLLPGTARLTPAPAEPGGERALNIPNGHAVFSRAK